MPHRYGVAAPSIKRTGNILCQDIPLPPGWASVLSPITMRILRHKIGSLCANADLNGLVITSPHYLPLLDHFPGVKKIYYCSDDYRNYVGWGKVAAREKEVVRRVDLSVFVSSALARRAVEKYHIPPASVMVLPNATEPRFFKSSSAGSSCSIESLRRPVAGVIGALNSRIDVDLLRRCLEVPELGELLLVGRAAPECSELEAIIRHPKCHYIPHVPHEHIDSYFKALDVALIAYASTPFNFFCSPMRLFDHLASGVPIVSTNACDQVSEFSNVIDIAKKREEFIDLLRFALKHGHDADRESEQLCVARKQTWDKRAQVFVERIFG